MATFESKFNIGDEVVWYYRDGQSTCPSIIKGVYFDRDGVSYNLAISGGQRTVKESELHIKPIPDTIDWSHVNPDFKWMARDENEEVCLFGSGEAPSIEDNIWLADDGYSCNAKCFTSYKQGNVDWKDSLVQRPEGI